MMSNFYSFPGVADTPKVASVIFPSCEDRDYVQVKTIYPGMTIVNHLSLFSNGAIIALNVMQVFATQPLAEVWKTEDAFLDDMCRFAQFKEYPSLIFVSNLEKAAYRIDPVSREKTFMGGVVYREKISDVEKEEVNIIYDHGAKEIGYIPLMMLGVARANTPGLAECAYRNIPMERVMEIKASGKVGRKW